MFIIEFMIVRTSGNNPFIYFILHQRYIFGANNFSHFIYSIICHLSGTLEEIFCSCIFRPVFLKQNMKINRKIVLLGELN